MINNENVRDSVIFMKHTKDPKQSVLSTQSVKSFRSTLYAVRSCQKIPYHVLKYDSTVLHGSERSRRDSKSINTSYFVFLPPLNNNQVSLWLDVTTDEHSCNSLQILHTIVIPS